MKKKLSKESISETKKGRAIFFVCDTPSYPHTHCYRVSRYSIWLLSYGVHKDSLKFHQRKVTQKGRMGEQSFLYSTHCHKLRHIAIKFHQDFPT